VHWFKASLKDNPENTDYQQNLCSQYRNIAETFLQLKKHAEAARAAEELAAAGRDAGPIPSFHAACFLSRCLSGVLSDPALSSQERRNQARDYARRVVELLRAAELRGYEDHAFLKRALAFYQRLTDKGFEDVPTSSIDLAKLLEALPRPPEFLERLSRWEADQASP